MSFDEFYAEYPRKVSKGAARKSYEKAVKVQGHDAIMIGLKAFNAHLEENPTERKFIPHPSTWLNQERWADEHKAKATIAEQLGADEARRQWERRYAEDPEYWGKFANMLKLHNVGPYARG